MKMNFVKKKYNFKEIQQWFPDFNKYQIHKLKNKR